MMPAWHEARAGAGRRRHSSFVCHPGWLQLVEKPPLGVFLAPHTPACLPTFLPACLPAYLLACTTTSAWCSHNTAGTCRLIFYLRLAYMHLAAAHTHLHISPRPPPVNFQTACVLLWRRYLKRFVVWITVSVYSIVAFIFFLLHSWQSECCIYKCLRWRHYGFETLYTIDVSTYSAFCSFILSLKRKKNVYLSWKLPDWKPTSWATVEVTIPYWDISKEKHAYPYGELGKINVDLAIYWIRTYALAHK